MQLQGETKLLFLHGFGKIRVLKKCLNGKEKLRLLYTIDVSCKISETAVRDLEKFFKLFATLRKKNRI